MIVYLSIIYRFLCFDLIPVMPAMRMDMWSKVRILDDGFGVVSPGSSEVNTAFGHAADEATVVKQIALILSFRC